MNSLLSKFKPSSKKKKEIQSASSSRASDIGQPYLVKHNIHVGYNPTTGLIEGLPLPWIDWLSTANISKTEQSANPKAVIDALKYYAHSVKRQDKFLTTQADIDADVREIEREWPSKDNLQDSGSDESSRSSKEDILTTNQATNGNNSKTSNDRKPTSPHYDVPTIKVNNNKASPAEQALSKELSNKLKVKAAKAATESESLKNGNLIDPEPVSNASTGSAASSNVPTPLMRRKKSSAQPRMSEEEVMEKLKEIVNQNDPKEKFELVKKVGSGASGTVYTAKDMVSDAKVAIKTMDLAQQPKKELIITEIVVMRENQ